MREGTQKASLILKISESFVCVLFSFNNEFYHRIWKTVTICIEMKMILNFLQEIGSNFWLIYSYDSDKKISNNRA